jgi:predicted site-specific integrase-resolvase
MEVIHLNQKQLATRWAISEATLERWRSEGIGPVFLKLTGQVRYRLVDIEAFEESCLTTPTRTHASQANVS